MKTPVYTPRWEFASYDFDHQEDSHVLETTNHSRDGGKNLEVLVAHVWAGSPTLCLPPHPPHPIRSVGHKKLPAWVQEEELFRHGRTGHDSLVLTGDLGHLVVVDSSLGLVGGDTVGSCGRRGGGPTARTGTPQNSCGHGLWRWEGQS